MTLVGKKRPKKVLMPSDYLSIADKRVYQRSGPMLVYSEGGTRKEMNDNLKELLAMTPKEAQDALKFKVHDVPDMIVAQEYGVELSVMRKFRQDLGLQKDRIGKVVSVGDSPKWPPNIRIDLDRQAKTAVQQIQVHPTAIAQVAAVPTEPKGFFVRFNGEYQVKDLSGYFDGVRAMLNANPENEGRKFKIKFELSETDEKREASL